MARNKFARGKLHVENICLSKKQKMHRMSIKERGIVVGLVEAGSSILVVGKCFINLISSDMHNICDICTEYCKISV